MCGLDNCWVVERCGFSDVKQYAKVASREHTCVTDSFGKEWFCVKSRGMVIAFYGLKISNCVARFSSNYTHPDYRRRGILARFIGHAKEYAVKRDCIRMTAYASGMSVGSHLRNGAVGIRESNGVTFVEYDLTKKK